MLSGNIVSPPSPQELHQQLLGIPNTPQGNQFLAGIVANDKSVKGGIAAAILNLRQKPPPVMPPEGGTVADGLVQKAQNPMGQAPQGVAPQEQAPQGAAPQEQAPQEAAPQEAAPQEDQESMGIAQPGLEEAAQESPMATGGLVAFNHGGNVRRFAAGSETRAKPFDTTQAEPEVANWLGKKYDAANMYADEALKAYFGEADNNMYPDEGSYFGNLMPDLSRFVPADTQITRRPNAAAALKEQYTPAASDVVSESPFFRVSRADRNAGVSPVVEGENFSPKTAMSYSPVDQKTILEKLGVEPFSEGIPSAQSESSVNLHPEFKQALEDKKGGDKNAPQYKTTTQSTPDQDKGTTVVVTDDSAAAVPTAVPTAAPIPEKKAAPAAEKKSASYDAKIKSVMDIFGVPPNIAAELYSEKEHDLAKDKNIHLIQDFAQGIGAALLHKAGPTGTGGRFKSDVPGAIGAGLMALVAGRMQSEKAEGVTQDKMDDLKVKSKMNDYEARKEAAKIVVSQETAAAKEERDWARRKQEIDLQGEWGVQKAMARAGMQQPHGLFKQNEKAQLWFAAGDNVIKKAADQWGTYDEGKKYKLQLEAYNQALAAAGLPPEQGPPTVTGAGSVPTTLPNGMVYRPPAA